VGMLDWLRGEPKHAPARGRGKGSPERGVYTSLGYRVVTQAATDGLAYQAGSGGMFQRTDRGKIIAQSRDFMRNNPIYVGMVDRAVTYIVGTGFNLRPSTGNKSWNARVEELWGGWWDRGRPETKALQTGRQLLQMMCREHIVAGDLGLIKLQDRHLQCVEAEQIATNKSTFPEGVVMGATGRPSAFYVAPYGRGGSVDRNSAQMVQARHFVFVTDPDRPSSVRTVPLMQSTFPMLHRINDVCDSEAIAWQLLARIAVTMNRDEGAALAYQESEADAAAEGTELATRLTEVGQALIFHAPPGHEIKGVDRNIPGQNFPEALRMFMRLLGLPLGLPLELVLLDWTQSNYSQSRAVLEQAYQTFSDKQLLLETALRDIYCWRVGLWIKEGKLGPRDDAFAAEWIKPSWPWLDQLKEAQAFGKKMELGIVTHTDTCKSLNSDRTDVVAAREAEIQDAIERAQRIEAATGEHVPWQVFAGLPISKDPQIADGLSAADAGNGDQPKPQGADE